jgi:hypothetical protein
MGCERFGRKFENYEKNPFTFVLFVQYFQDIFFGRTVNPFCLCSEAKNSTYYILEERQQVGHLHIKKYQWHIIIAPIRRQGSPPRLWPIGGHPQRPGFLRHFLAHLIIFGELALDPEQQLRATTRGH